MIRCILTTLAVVASTVGFSPPPLANDVGVRVFADARVESVEFSASGTGVLVVAEAGETLVELPAGEAVTVEVWRGLLRVRWRRGSAPVSLIEIASTSTVEVSPGERATRLFRGSIHASLDDGGASLLLVNTVDIEDYVASVLPAEYPFTEIEGAKAQAIVIRSYAMAAGLRAGSDYVLRDDVGSQVYRGVEMETEFSRTVAAMTAGSVLLYEGEIVEAVYSSHCGGHSASNEDIWGTSPVPYLRGRKDPYDHDAPVAKWQTSADVSDVHDGLSRALGKQVRGIKVMERGAGDHVRTVAIDVDRGPDLDVSGERFRSLINEAVGRPVVMSSKFEIKKRSGDYQIEGRGNGHGVGFCQWGAAEQAKQGRDHQDILTYYYKDVELTEPHSEALVVEERVALDAAPTYQPKPTQDRSDPVKRAQKRRPGW